MTALLEKAMAAVQALTEKDQDAIAAIVLEQLEGDREWDSVLARHPETMTRLVAELDEEKRAGRMRELNADQL